MREERDKQTWTHGRRVFACLLESLIELHMTNCPGLIFFVPSNWVMWRSCLQKLPSFHSWHCFWSSGSADAAPFPHGSHFNRVSFSWRRMRQRAACCAAKASVLLTGNLDVICLICESVTGVWPWSKVVASAAVMNNLPYGIDASQRHFFFCT